MLAHGLGRSYGDVCLNDGGTLLLTALSSRVLDFSPKTKLIRAEAGISFEALLRFAVPRGFFLPVTPGTKFVTLGGAVANDVHGKNHHVAGTIGCHVRRLALRRSNGEVLVCSPEQEKDLFRATIGGLGLTGLILWVELALLEISSSEIEVETLIFTSLDEFLEIQKDSDHSHPYTVAWVDTLDPKGLGRGHFMRGRHVHGQGSADLKLPGPTRLSIPLDAPELLLGSWSMRAFNEIYYRKQTSPRSKKNTSYEPFFYPLDIVHAWNRLYGKRGFYQFQCVLPPERVDTMRAILRGISASQNGSFLAVLKTFGSISSPGLLSFPRPGLTLALDFANRGPRTLNLLRELEGLVTAAGGRLYPAKDATMQPGTFAQGYPLLAEFKRMLDPGFSSSFWRRLT